VQWERVLSTVEHCAALALCGCSGCHVHHWLWCWQTEATALWPYHPDMTAILFPSMTVVHRIIMSSLERRHIRTRHEWAADDLRDRRRHRRNALTPRYRPTDRQPLTIRSSRSENPRNDVYPSVTIFAWLIPSAGQVSGRQSASVLVNVRG